MRKSLLFAALATGILPSVLLAEGRTSFGQYKPQPLVPSVIAELTAVEVALDANGGRKNPYLYAQPDPSNDNHLWSLTKVGDYYMICPTVADVALDANGGRNNPYFRGPDPSNDNHLWQLKKVADDYMILPKVAPVALDANGGRRNPYFSTKPNPTNANHLWVLKPVGPYFMIIPKVQTQVMHFVAGEGERATGGSESVLITDFLFSPQRSRSEVVVFKYPESPGRHVERNYVKRLVGLPGETIISRQEPLDKAASPATERITIEGGKVEIRGDSIKIDGGKVQITTASPAGRSTIRRPQNYCAACGYTWYPPGSDLSRRCPNCGSRRADP